MRRSGASSGSAILKIAVAATAGALALLVGGADAAVRVYGPAWVNGRLVQGPYGRRAPANARARGAQRAAPGVNRRPTVNVKGDGKRAAIDLTSEVDALKGRHAALVAKLPQDLRRLDPQMLATVERLPKLAQFSYLTTVEDYPSLTSAEQGQLRTLMQGVTGLPEKDRERFVEGAGKTFGDLESSATQAKSARNQPHATCFRLNGELDQLRNPAPVKPADPVAPAPPAGRTERPKPAPGN